MVFLSCGAPAHADRAQQYAAIVYDPYAGRVVYDWQAHAEIYPASLAKMMTLYIVFEDLKFERLKLNTLMVTSKNATEKWPSKLDLTRGERISVRTGIKALIVKSANDVATVFAEHISGSEWNFARRMNQTAARLGMTRTTFTNASGLPDKRQVSTVHDMMLLGTALLQDFPEQKGFWRLQRFAYGGTLHTSHNRLLSNLPGAIGMKTGFIRASGYHAATAVERAGRRLIIIVAGRRSTSSRDRHVRELAERYLPMAQPDPRLLLDLAKSERDALLTNRKWAIQVGAFPSVRGALDQLNRVRLLLDPDLNAAHPTTTSYRKDNRTFYRSRFANLEETRAREMCQRLASHRMSCLTIAPDARFTR